MWTPVVVSCIRSKRENEVSELPMKRTTRISWTPAEDKILRKHYGKMPRKEILRMLPGRSATALHTRASRLGIQPRPHWSPEDDVLLTEMWSTCEKGDTMCKALGRSREAIHWRASKLGLTGKAPPGCEYITSAANSRGFDISTFKHILKWHGLRLIHRDGRRGNGKRNKFVESHFADDAVNAYMDSYSISDLAKELGRCKQTAIHWVKESGIKYTTYCGRNIRIASEELPKLREWAKNLWTVNCISCGQYAKATRRDQLTCGARHCIVQYMRNPELQCAAQ